jgi:16S rRNA (guanine527-N7)-methyltransferase
VAVDILCTRIENPETHAKVGAVHCVTARALAPLPRLVELVAPYFTSSTLGLFLKGREVAAEIEEAARSWQFASELHPSLTDKDARVVLLKALKRKTAQPKTED